MIRATTVADAPLTRAFRIQLLAENLATIFEGTPPTPEQQEAFHRRYDDDGRSVMFAYLDDGAVVGLVAFDSFGSAPQCDHAGRVSVSVLSTHRARGIGTALLNRVVEWADAHPDVLRLELEVFSNNPRAKALYERLGWVVEGVKKDAVQLGGGYVDSIVMTRWVGR